MPFLLLKKVFKIMFKQYRFLKIFSSKLQVRFFELIIYLNNQLSYLLFKFNIKDNANFKEIESFKNIYLTNKSNDSEMICVIIGNGPSVRTKDLNRIMKLKNVVTFCANRFYLAYNKTKLRPTYYVSSDSQVINDFGSELIKKHCSKKLFFTSLKKIKLNSEKFIKLNLSLLRRFKFSKNIARGHNVGCSTLTSAVQIGYHMGLRKFYFYGVDHNFNFKMSTDNQAQGDDNHFIKNYRSGKKWYPPLTNLIEEGFERSDKFLRENGGFLINISRRSKLEILEKRNIDDLFKASEI